MCGIAAIASEAKDAGLTARLAGMLACLRHRGPDDLGTWVDAQGKTALGQTRLAILDLSPRGRQPMSNEDGTIWVTFNGEIYNWQELRRELEAKGHHFCSNTDGEVLLHLYEEVGVAMLERLRGMFAFALWDSRAQRLFAARDRVGKKPLVYAQIATARGRAVVMASELPAVLSIPEVDRSLCGEAVAMYLLRHFRHVPDPWTLYAGVKRLPPGHAMIVENGEITRHWMWWLPVPQTADISAEEVAAVLDEAVKVRCVADVEIAALLSGGVDSSAIVESMVRQQDMRPRTFALGRDRDDDELERARAAAELFRTAHREIYFDPATHHDGFVELIARYGEPVALLPLVHTLALCRAIRAAGVKVLLSGHGADELFFGYSSHAGQAMVSDVERLTPRPFRSIFRSLAPALAWHDGLSHAATVLGAPPGLRRAALYAGEAHRLWPWLLMPEARPDADGLVARWIEAIPGSYAKASYIDEAMGVALHGENAPSITIAGDLPAMAAGVEMRCPFLDQRVIDLAYRIDYRRKVGLRRDRIRTKRILKQALRGRLPDSILSASKRGFGFNIQERDVLAGPWRERVAAALAEADDLGGILDLAAVRRLPHELDGPQGRAKAQLLLKVYGLVLARQQVASASPRAAA